jgi:hypothetical protein
MRALIKADGTRQDLDTRQTMAAIKRLIDASSLDTVSLRHMGQPAHVMLLDDLGHDRGLPVNAEATQLYHANCRPGTTHTIRGDVVVVPDADF